MAIRKIDVTKVTLTEQQELSRIALYHCSSGTLFTLTEQQNKNRTHLITFRFLKRLSSRLKIGKVTPIHIKEDRLMEENSK